MLSKIVVSKKGVSQICHWENNIVNRRVADGSRSETGGQIELVFREIPIAGAEIVHWSLELNRAVSMALVLVARIWFFLDFSKLSKPKKHSRLGIEHVGIVLLR